LTKIVEIHRLFASLTSADRMSLAGKFRFLEVEQGAVLMEQGKPAPVRRGLVADDRPGTTASPWKQIGDIS